MTKRFTVSLPGMALLLAVLLGNSTAAAAQQSPALDRFSLSVGGFDEHSSTLLHARTTNGMFYGDVHLEKELGFPRRDWTRRIRADVLIGDSQGLSFDFYRFRSQNSTSLAKSIDYQGTIFDIHSRAEGKLGFDFGSVAYRWWFGSGNDVVGFGLGAGYYRIEASILGQATVNGYSARAYAATNSNAWAPLLQLGWRHAFSRNWRLYFNASGVKKNGGRLYGHAYRASLGAQWFPLPRLGISAEYDLQRIRLWRRHAYFDDSLDLKLDGPAIYATLRF